MDFDGDGKLDLISGSYDPGELYLFRGLGGGKFAAREVIKDESGKPILRVPDQKDRVESFGSWMTMVDWNDDGKPDVLVGGFDGTMFLRRNVGTRTRPAFAAENEWIKVGKKKLQVPGGAHANPVIADWDQDGLWDIVTGSSDGGVYWYRNTGQRGQPEMAPPVALVAPHEGHGYDELLDAGQEPKPGIRSQIAVIDYDGDGKLDVLLGDFCTNLHVKKDLSAKEREEFASLREQMKATGKRMGDRMKDVQARFKELLKDVPMEDWHTKENSEKWQKMYQEMRASAEYKKDSAEYEKLQKGLPKYLEPAAPDSEPGVPHGYVWLLRGR